MARRWLSVLSPRDESEGEMSNRIERLCELSDTLSDLKCRDAARKAAARQAVRQSGGKLLFWGCDLLTAHQTDAGESAVTDSPAVDSHTNPTFTGEANDGQVD